MRRKARVEGSLMCLFDINKNFKNVEFARDILDQLPIDDIPEKIEEDFVYVDQEDKSGDKVGYDNIDRENDGNYQSEQEEIIFSCSLLSNTAESIAHDLVEQLNILQKAHEKSQQNGSCDTSWYLKMVHDCPKPVSEINNPDHLLNAYPTLFPLGIGGIGDPRRKIKLSYREHVNYLLRLNSDRFSSHRSFMFVVNKT